MISQEYFDDLCWENANVFDMSPDQAVQETIQQLQLQQHLQQQQVVPATTATPTTSTSRTHVASLSHLTWTFPTSPRGQAERARRRCLQNWLHVLSLPFPLDSADHSHQNNDENSNNNDENNGRRRRGSDQLLLSSSHETTTTTTTTTTIEDKIQAVQNILQALQLTNPAEQHEKQRPDSTTTTTTTTTTDHSGNTNHNDTNHNDNTDHRDLPADSLLPFFWYAQGLATCLNAITDALRMSCLLLTRDDTRRIHAPPSREHDQHQHQHDDEQLALLLRFLWQLLMRLILYHHHQQPHHQPHHQPQTEPSEREETCHGKQQGEHSPPCASQSTTTATTTTTTTATTPWLEFLAQLQAALRPSLVQAVWLYLETYHAHLTQTQPEKDSSSLLVWRLMVQFMYWTGKHSEAMKRLWMNGITTNATVESLSSSSSSSVPPRLLYGWLQDLVSLFSTTTCWSSSTETPLTVDSSLLLLDLLQSIGQLIAVYCTFDELPVMSTTVSSSSASASPLPVTAGTTHAIAQALQPTIVPLHQLWQCLWPSLEQSQSVPVSGSLSSQRPASAAASRRATLAVVSALRALAMQKDSVQIMIDVGILETCQTVLQSIFTTIVVMQQQQEPQESTEDDRENATNQTSMESSDSVNVPKESHHNTAVVASSSDNLGDNSTRSKPFQADDSTLALLTAILRLIRNLANDDHVKTSICGPQAKYAILSSYVCQAMSQFPAHAALQEHACAIWVAVCLRQPDNATYAVTVLQAHVLVLRAMQRHATRVALQRQGAMACRNFVSRSPELRPILLQDGASTILQQITARVAVDEAFAALRDLGITQARLLHAETNERNEVVWKPTAQFGQRASNFRPVYDDH